MKHQEYLDLVEELLAENKTTGDDHSESMIHYTKMNFQRMKRWQTKGQLDEKTIEKIKGIKAPQKWVVLTEGWCGDAAHSVPFIAKMAEANTNISLEVKLRDENLDLMDQYLTNGGRSIPKLIAFDETGNELFNWGPRPAQMQEFVLESKENEVPYSEYNVGLQKIYNADKGQSIQKEIIEKF